MEHKHYIRHTYIQHTVYGYQIHIHVSIQSQVYTLRCRRKHIEIQAEHVSGDIKRNASKGQLQTRLLSPKWKGGTGSTSRLAETDFEISLGFAEIRFTRDYEENLSWFYKQKLRLQEPRLPWKYLKVLQTEIRFTRGNFSNDRTYVNKLCRSRQICIRNFFDQHTAAKFIFPPDMDRICARRDLFKL